MAAATRNEDRKREASTSPQRNEEPKRNKQNLFEVVDNEGKHINVNLDNLEAENHGNLILTIHSLLGWIEKYRSIESDLESKNLKLSNEIKDCKIAFADKALKFLSNTPSYIGYEDPASWKKSPDTGSVILTAETTKPINISYLDALLGSKTNGPVAQCVRQKDNKVTLTFNDKETKEEAKAIMETSPECQEIFKSISEPTLFYPVIVRHVGIDKTEETILEDMK